MLYFNSTNGLYLIFAFFCTFGYLQILNFCCRFLFVMPRNVVLGSMIEMFQRKFQVKVDARALLY